MHSGILGGLFLLVYIGCTIGVVIYVLTLLRRFVIAHERMTDTLENVARKFREDGR